jgi:hypothetical protein
LACLNRDHALGRFSSNVPERYMGERANVNGTYNRTSQHRYLDIVRFEAKAWPFEREKARTEPL